MNCGPYSAALGPDLCAPQRCEPDTGAEDDAPSALCDNGDLCGRSAAAAGGGGGGGDTDLSLNDPRYMALADAQLLVVSRPKPFMHIP